MRASVNSFGFAALLLFGNAAIAADSVGESIYQHCKNCHGAAGEGGEAGKYPRIAGLPQAYIEKQLNDFKLRKRLNKPMLPIFKNWRFNQDAMAEVAAYLTALPAPDVPPFEPSAKRLADFDSREEFEAIGQELFEGTCAQCHGDDGQGRADKESPPLVNQYPDYLIRQIGDFINGRREHEHAQKMFGELYEEEVESLMAYLGKLGKKD
jgi:cytochrome c553